MPAAPAALVHQALFYDDPDGFVRGASTFLRAGAELGEPALVAVRAERLDLLRAATGDLADRILFIDVAEVGRNPGRAIPGVLGFAAGHPGRRVRIVGEQVWPSRSAAERRAAVQNEALMNLALADCPASILCAYDAARLDGRAVDEARRTHPVLVERGWSRTSPDYADPRVIADGAFRDMPEPPAWWGDTLVFRGAADLPGVRRFVGNLAARAGLPPDRVADLCLAVDAAASNTVEHAGGAGLVTVWQDDGMVVCEVCDGGRVPSRLAGRIPAPPSALRGRGLLLVHAVCDLVEMPTGRFDDGTTLRMHMWLPWRDD